MGPRLCSVDHQGLGEGKVSEAGWLGEEVSGVLGVSGLGEGGLGEGKGFAGGGGGEGQTLPPPKEPTDDVF